MQNKSDLRDIWGDYKCYKNIKIYPVLMKDIDTFYNKSYSIMIDKEGFSASFNDPTILTMSYFDFYNSLVCMAVNEDGDKLLPNGLEDLFSVLKIALREQDFSIATDLKTGRPVIFVSVENNKVMTIRGMEFDKIREIILKQNNMYIDQPKNLHPEVKKSMEKAIEYFAKKQKGKMATLEEQIATYSVATKTPIEEIKKMTIYQFDFNINRMSWMMECFKIWSMSASGMIPIEDIPNCLQHIPKTNKYDEILISGSELNKFKEIS
ncbi:hypothetical protein [Clostridium rectalis]|uniref:hypothetical protein n=1 Tax=Clostridium rectalis TaxID=2040295 RepID=UPI000F62E028|nr:hypothetical protein [Clostridium rectalis]